MPISGPSFVGSDYEATEQHDSFVARLFQCPPAVPISGPSFVGSDSGHPLRGAGVTEVTRSRTTPASWDSGPIATLCTSSRMVRLLHTGDLPHVGRHGTGGGAFPTVEANG